MKRWITVSGFCLAIAAQMETSAYAGVSVDKSAPIKTVGIAPIFKAGLSDDAVDVLLKLAQEEHRNIDRDGVRLNAREQASLARMAQSAHSDAELFPDAHVGFALDVAVEDRLAGILRSLFREALETALRGLPGGNLEALVVSAPAPSRAELEACLGSGNHLRVSYDMTPAQRERARGIIVLRYRLAPGEGERTLDLAELYRRQNAQGRISLGNYDLSFLHQQAMQYLAERFVLDQVARSHGTAFVDELRGWLTDRERVTALARWYGVGADAHDQIPHLAALAARVDKTDIERYYAGHREEFVHIDGVKARHIRVADESTANRVAGELAHDGSNFADIATRNSVSPDAKTGGDLGWIDAKDHGWLGDLAFTQPPLQVGKPTRAPAPENVSAAWEIVYVEARRTSYYPADSTTVASEARRAIASARSAAEFQTLKAQARKEAQSPGATPATGARR